MMNDAPEIRRDLLPIYEVGVTLARDVEAHFTNWPAKDDGTPVWTMHLPKEFRTATEALRERVHRWFNELAVSVLPLTTYDKPYLQKLLRRANAAVGGKEYHDEYLRKEFEFLSRKSQPQYRKEYAVDVPTTPGDARVEASRVFDTALRMIRTIPASMPPYISGPRNSIASYVHGTAFILMWMDPSRPELVDIHEAVQSVFAEFGVHAVRADDIEHQETITEVVLDNISKAEFLVADLSGERPNVYYEVGYAHALGKRPILFRRAGTPLHFDLSVHNVPEYNNLSELKELLRKRLIAITGRSPASRRG